MTIFFETIATLMSLLLRRVVENSLADLVSIFTDFADGNGYEGSYDLFGRLGLPLLPHPIRIFLVYSYISYYDVRVLNYTVLAVKSKLKCK